MACRSLAELLEDLRSAGQLLRVSQEVDAAGQAAEIVRQMAGRNGPALLFERVAGSRWPVLAGLWGSEQRACLALGVESPADISGKAAQMLLAPRPEGWWQAMKMMPQLTQHSAFAPKTVKHAPCQQVVRLASDIHLPDLPLFTCWPQDSAAALHLAQVWTPGPTKLSPRLHSSPVQLLDTRTLLLRTSDADTALFGLPPWSSLNNPTPVSITLGGDPLLMWLSSLLLPADADPVLMAGMWHGQPLELTPGRTSDLHIPAQSDMVLECIFDPKGTQSTGGPLIDRMGYVSEGRKYPTLQVQAITHRANPLLPAFVPGPAMAEETVLAQLAERFWLPWLQRAAPEVAEAKIVNQAGCPRVMLVAMHKKFPQQARRAAAAIWGCEPFARAKMLVLLDADVDVHNSAQVWQQLAATFHPGRDLIPFTGPADLRDSTFSPSSAGQSLALDATRKLPGEQETPTPTAAQADGDLVQSLLQQWATLGLPADNE